MGDQARAAAAAGLADQVRAHVRQEALDVRCVAAYVAMPDEPDTGPLLESWLAAGLRVLVPRVMDGGLLEWCDYIGPDNLARGVYGIDEPTGPAAGQGAAGLRDNDVDLLVLPALGVDEGGVRLGQGGGYFDRLLAVLRPGATSSDLHPVSPLGHQGPEILALVYDDDVLPVGAIPTDPHDRGVDVVVTPTRTIRAVTN
jgi:5-formyltetrahydrofolate cyclo-ligase